MAKVLNKYSSYLSTDLYTLMSFSLTRVSAK